MIVVLPTVNLIVRRLSRACTGGRHRIADMLGHQARGPRWRTGMRKCRRIVARRRRVANVVSRFMDYGPDWPPAPKPPPPRHTLLRRCVTTVVLYALIWAVGSVLLELRLFELGHLHGGTTTYTTVVDPRH